MFHEPCASAGARVYVHSGPWRVYGGRALVACVHGRVSPRPVLVRERMEWGRGGGCARACLPCAWRKLNVDGQGSMAGSLAASDLLGTRGTRASGGLLWASGHAQGGLVGVKIRACLAVGGTRGTGGARRGARGA